MAVEGHMMDRQRCYSTIYPVLEYRPTVLFEFCIAGHIAKLNENLSQYDIAGCIYTIW